MSEQHRKIIFTCPNCKTKYAALPEHTGKKGKCKSCGVQITVPKLKSETTECEIPAEIVGSFIFCRNCGKRINEKAEICLNCSVRPFAENKFCQECGTQTNPKQEICVKCGVRLKRRVVITEAGTPIKTDFSRLSSYYQKEFKKIYESKELYKGKWNWAAFFFGPIWALTKGVWLPPVIDIGASIVTGGIAGLVYWFIFAVRGNFMFYSAFAKNKQLFV